MIRTSVPLLCLLLCACSATALQPDVQPLSGESLSLSDSLTSKGLAANNEWTTPSSAQDSGRSAPRWEKGQTMLQGFAGMTSFTKVEVDGTEVDGDDGDLDELPMIGGGVQYKMAGQRIDFGLEGLFSLAWRTDASAYAIGGGGAVVAVDTDLLLLELYGGPFANMFLGKHLRAYASAGPLLQFADYDQHDDSGALDQDGSGFGAGGYGRIGLELRLPSRMWLGLGARWSDTRVSLDNDVGDLDLEGFQFMLTFSQGI
jgi:hypothetical protein